MRLATAPLAPAARPSELDLSSWLRRHRALLAGIAVTGLALALRAVRLSTAYDVFVDEVSYLRISQNVAEHLRVELYGSPFYLHPPGAFLLQAAFLKLAGITGGVEQQVLAVRWYSVLFAGATAALLFVTARRIAGTPAGVIAAGIYALDPLIVRTSSRNLLEAETTFWAVLGLALLVHGLRDQRGPGARRCIAAGVCLGAALLSKETSFFITVVPLLVCAAAGWALPRRRSLLAAAVALATYAVYPLSTVFTGDLGLYLQAKLHGGARLAGLAQESGFHAPGAPSFIGTVLDNLGLYATTYALSALALVAALLLLRRRGRPDRLVACWTLSAIALLGYTVVAGALEEQMFYYLLVFAALALAAVAPGLPLPRGAALLAGIVAAGYVGLSASVWAQLCLTPDDAYGQLVTYVDRQVPVDAHLSVTSEPAEFLLPHGVIGQWATVADLRANQVDYVLVSSRQVAAGYSAGDPSFYAWLPQHGRVVFSAAGRSYGELRLYRMDQSY